MHPRCLRWLAPLLLLPMLATSAAAGPSSCTFSSVAGLAFGLYNPESPSPLDSVGSFTGSCTGVATVVIDLSRGSSPSYSPRELLYGSHTLSYNLYLDPTRTTIWGDGTGGTSHFGPSTPASGGSYTLDIYGRVFPQQNVPAGSYADSVIITVNF